jgi:hypothetical protein
MEAMKKIDDDTLQHLEDAFVNRKIKKDYSPYKATSPAEEAVLELLRYVDCVDQHIEGSTGEVTAMREEMRAICRASGTPSLFFTLNPADTYNPLCSFAAGKDIDIDALFDNPDSRFTTFDRARTLADNPVAGADFFKLMVDQFLEKFLGCAHGSKRGVFGRVKFYYGVIESQSRGSLHLHILIWLEGTFIVFCPQLFSYCK